MDMEIASQRQDGASVNRAKRREWIGLAILTLPCLIYSMDLTVLNLAVPALSVALEPTATQLLWILDVYGFFLAGMLITMGALGDRIGRRRLLMSGAAAFGVTSIIASLSNSPQVLILARAVLGVAGATLAPATLSLIRTLFHDAHERRIAISVWTAGFSAGAAIGPLIGGVLLQYFWWGSVLLVALPVMVLLLVLGPRFLPEYRSQSSGEVDIASAALSLTAVLGPVYGLKRAAEYGIDVTSVSCMTVGLVLGALFVRRQFRLESPMIDLKLFRSRSFSTALAIYVLGSFVMFGSFMFISQYIQLVLGLDPRAAGLWSLPFGLVFILGSILTPVIARNLRNSTVIILGLLVAIAGFSLLSRVDQTTSPKVLCAICCTYYLGLACVFTLITDAIVGGVSPDQAGAASSVSETGSELGGALGIAVLGSIGTAVYRAFLGHSGSLAHDFKTSTVAAAVREARHVGGLLGSALLQASRSAFVEALHTAAIVSIGILGVAIVLAVRGLDPPVPVDDESN